MFRSVNDHLQKTNNNIWGNYYYINHSTSWCTWSIGHPWNFAFHFSFLNLRQSVGLLGLGISPTQGRYLHTEQHKHRINADKHPSLEWDSNQWPQRSSERRHLMPQTARPLWSSCERLERKKKCGNWFRRARNQECLCWRGPVAIYWIGRSTIRSFTFNTSSKNQKAGRLFVSGIRLNQCKGHVWKMFRYSE
jgi:hypothetical protein